jgi:hypothetical protein
VCPLISRHDCDHPPLPARTSPDTASGRPRRMTLASRSVKSRLASLPPRERAVDQHGAAASPFGRSERRRVPMRGSITTSSVGACRWAPACISSHRTRVIHQKPEARSAGVCIDRRVWGASPSAPLNLENFTGPAPGWRAAQGRSRREGPRRYRRGEGSARPRSSSAQARGDDAGRPACRLSGRRPLRPQRGEIGGTASIC